MSCENKDLSKLSLAELEEDRRYHLSEAKIASEENIWWNLAVLHVPIDIIDFEGSEDHETRAQQITEVLAKKQPHS